MTEESGSSRLKQVEARTALASALQKAGVFFPPLVVRVREENGEPVYGLIDLGKISPPVAHALADAIDRGTQR
ncbi:hypothetical protein [Streptomyces sp. Wb2n-11]|uniref:hypothetical protein n=1 Tax=Streptomyces sp. Wb2n-11 TaxID=1030533 RepID=UPI000A692FD5|nr:hypothetical protein [Streptomyces sp. Wb2n-11]